MSSDLEKFVPDEKGNMNTGVRKDNRETGVLVTLTGKSWSKRDDKRNDIGILLSLQKTHGFITGFKKHVVVLKRMLIG